MSKPWLFSACLLLTACDAPAPASPIEIRVLVGLHTLAAAEIGTHVHHYTLQLADGASAVRATYRTPNVTAVFHGVGNGTYHLLAEAFDSADDSHSITTGGSQSSSNTVTVNNKLVTYSDGGGSLRAPLHLLDATGEMAPLTLTENPGHPWTGVPVGAP